MHPDVLQEIARQRTSDLVRDAERHRLAALARPPKRVMRSERSLLRRFARHLAPAR